MQDERDANPLVKRVPGQLFSYEEKVFGVMTLTQLLCDIGAGVGILSVTGGLPLVARLVVSAFLALLSLILIHGKVQEQTFIHWLYVYSRSLFIAKHTTWQCLEELQKAARTGRKKRSDRKADGAPIQTTWIPMDSLELGIVGYSEPGSKGTAGRYWAVLECEGRNVRFLPEADQVKNFRRFESFLCGLEFRLQFVSHVEQVDPAHYPPLRVQKDALSALAATPRLAALQRATIAYQEKHLPNCTLTRHFVVVSATAQEEAARASDGEKQGILSFLWRSFFRPKRAAIPRQQVLDQLRIRISVVKKILQQLDVRSQVLDDTGVLQQFVMCLALGVDPPRFTAQRIDEATEAALHLSTVQHEARVDDDPLAREEVPSTEKGSTRSLHANKVRRRTYKKCVKGVHGTFLYKSSTPTSRFEAGVVRLADLVSPSKIDISPDVVEINVRGTKRFQRYFHVVGYGHQLLCGWLGDLAELGLPMVVSTSFEPIDSQYMINRLEMQLVRLESRSIADSKSIRVGRASRTIEADQIRAVTHALAGKTMRVFSVQMTIGIHAGSKERLEQRTQYLLSHLRQKQLKVRVATRRQDAAWQSTLPTCPMTEMETSINLPSDVVSSFLHMSSGVIGTPTGVFMGFAGSGMSRRPVFFNPWSEDRKIPNPHMVFVGESGMGKSFTGKVFTTGIMGLGIADVVVLDRDDDYLPLHEYLQGESQRYNLARGCPINFFDLPYAPSDVDPDDASDLLSEFIDNSLLAGLTLLLCDADARLSKIEEAYLMHVARTAYAAVGITSEAIRNAPETLLKPMPTLSDFIEVMRHTPASSESMQASLIERLEKASYLFSGQTSVSIDKPLTVFGIRELDEKWYALMTFTVQNFLMRHRALRQDERYLAYVVEEASYMLRHPAGRKYLETGSRGFRKLGIAQITLSQHPREFLTDGAIILNNCGTACFLGMQQYAAQELHLPEELERTLTAAIPGQIVMRVGNEYAAVTIAASPLHAKIFTTAPQERRKLRERAHKQQRVSALAS